MKYLLIIFFICSAMLTTGQTCQLKNGRYRLITTHDTVRPLIYGEIIVRNRKFVEEDFSADGKPINRINKGRIRKVGRCGFVLDFTRVGNRSLLDVYLPKATIADQLVYQIEEVQKDSFYFQVRSQFPEMAKIKGVFIKLK